MYKNRSRGFTLIELLVVIAIIGILSAVVLASLNTARTKGQDAAVQSNLDAIRVQAELYYSNNSNSYGTVAFSNTLATCVAAGSLFNDTTINRALTQADTTNGTGGIMCEAGATFYYVGAALPTAPTAAYWCVDSTGAAKSVAAALPTADIGSACP